METVGREFTVIVTVSEFVPQEAVMEKVYVVVIEGVATGFAQVVQLKPVEGDQINVPLPVPDKVVLLPSQMVAEGPALAEGTAGYVMVAASVADPQLLVTVSVYVVTAVGVATGFAQVVQLNPEEGAHENVPLPVPFRTTLSPEQTEISGPAFAVGAGVIVTVCDFVPEHPFVVAVTE